MLVSLIKNERISNINLPSKYYGIYWVNDISNGEEKPLVSVEAINGKWYLNSNEDAVIIENNVEVAQKELENYKFYQILNKQSKSIEVLYCSPTYDLTNEKYYMNKNSVLIGTDANCDIRINDARIEKNHAQISFQNGLFVVSDINSKLGVYANDIRVRKQVTLTSGDSIFICGIKIIVVCEKEKPILIINNPNDRVNPSVTNLTKIVDKDNTAELDDLQLDDLSLYKPDDYFHKKPRFKEYITPLNINVDAPPAKAPKSDMPAILTIGPMVTSSAISLIYGYMTVQNLIANGKNFLSAWPSFTVCILSLMATLVWPFILRKYTKYKEKKNEKYRTQQYNEYIENLMKTINENLATQQRIIIQNNPSISVCQEIIEKRDVSFWNRKFGDDDFLCINIGIGNIPMFIDIKVPEIHFQLEKDELLEKVAKMRYELPILENVPVIYNFLDKKVTATIGENNLNKYFINQIIFQIITLHSYDDVKIVVLTDEEKDKLKQWEYIKILPHAWSNDKTIRFYGSTKDEIREICYYLDNIYNQRISSENKKNNKMPFYLIVTDNYQTIRNFEFIKKFLDNDNNMGFGLLIQNDKVYNLPAICDNFINVSTNTCEIFQNVLNSQVQKFKLDLTTQLDMYKYARILANIPIEFSDNDSDALPTKIGFLEMYNVGKIEQLNILNRWRESNPILSLQSLVGLGKGGEKIYLDLHEKYHGPHGLIAGMTGSGKSECIATYILSLAINYHPKEVQFILIDYKGGGLAGIFENKFTGIKLPHLIGTITNLDENEIKRSLASIESELRRRQVVFGKVREKLGDSVVDIYKYQQLYRDGLVDEAISHLFIICDEFAELKVQQPEFLQQLISISRIGRSLGIHLILSTQKPSGVVDNQIWSNSKFRVCLRVQEKADSVEVIKTPDAAFLKDAGRFYLQVGYNEVFISGQAAWGGGRYIPTDKVKKKIDYNVEFVNNIGYPIRKVDTTKKNNDDINYGEEIKNIIAHIDNLAEEEHIENKQLWLDKMPPYININDLKRKYNFLKDPYIIDIPVGEYDIPYHQMQKLLTVPLSKEGNALVYGSAGSGKENFFTTMLYSSITSYTPSELIYYIFDFGTESLKNFSGIPHIGDVICAGENEKVQNLFKLLLYMIDERKELFKNFGGSYNVHSRNSDKKVPNVVVMINNYDMYNENYSSNEELLIQLTREGPKYGIYFVISVSNPNNLRSKLRQNFKLNYVLQQNNQADYSNILGKINNLMPSHIFGRGIVKIDEVYEFQTAMVSERDKIFSYIEQVKPLLIENSRVRAISVPTLPNIVTYDDIAPFLTQDSNIIVGIQRDNLDTIKYDLKQNYVNLFTTFDLNLFGRFLTPFIKQIEYSNCFDINIINCENIPISCDSSTIYNNNFDAVFENLMSFVEQNNQIYISQNYDRNSVSSNVNKLCIIVGFDKFKSKLSKENSDRLGTLLEKGKDLGIINYIIIDTVDKLRKYEYDSWYKTVVNNTKGIFLGNGITEQMTLRITKNDRNLREDIADNFCYVISHGRPELVKYVEKFDVK